MKQVKRLRSALAALLAVVMLLSFTTVGTLAVEDTASEPAAQADLIDFAFARMILGNALDMQFAFPKAGVAAGSYVEVVRTAANGSKVAQTIAYEDFSSATINKVPHFYVTYSGIAAKEMADTIVATVYDADGNAISNGWTDSVREYALRSLRAANTTEKNKKMLVGMLNYGAAAQTYFKYNDADLANKDLTADEQALAITAGSIESVLVKGAKNKGSRLILESSIKVQQAFSGLNADMYATVEFTNYNGREISETIPGSEFQLGSVSIIELDQVVLADARTPYTLTIYNADGTVYDTHVDSVASYITRASENALHDAIMDFADSAYFYFKGELPVQPEEPEVPAVLPLTVVKGGFDFLKDGSAADLGFNTGKTMLCFKVTVPEGCDWSNGVAVEYKITDAAGNLIMDYTGTRNITTAAGSNYQFSLTADGNLEEGYTLAGLQGMTGVGVEISIVDGETTYTAKETGLTIDTYDAAIGAEPLTIVADAFDALADGTKADIGFNSGRTMLCFKVTVPEGCDWSEGVDFDYTISNSEGNVVLAASGTRSITTAAGESYQFSSTALTEGYTVAALQGAENVTIEIMITDGDTKYYAKETGLTIDSYEAKALTVATGTYDYLSSGVAADLGFNSGKTMLCFRVTVPENVDWSTGVNVEYKITDADGTLIMEYTGTRNITNAPGENYQFAMTASGNLKNGYTLAALQGMTGVGVEVTITDSKTSYAAKATDLTVDTYTPEVTETLPLTIAKGGFDYLADGTTADLGFNSTASMLCFKINVPTDVDWSEGVNVEYKITEADGALIMDYVGTRNIVADEAGTYQLSLSAEGNLEAGYTLEGLQGKDDVTVEITITNGATAYYAKETNLTVDTYKKAATDSVVPLVIQKNRFDRLESGVGSALGFNTATPPTMLAFIIEIPEGCDWSNGVVVDYKITEADGDVIMEYYSGNRKVTTSANGTYQFSLSASDYLKDGFTLGGLQGRDDITVEITVIDGNTTYYAKETNLTVEKFTTKEASFVRGAYEDGAADIWFNSSNTQLMFKANVPTDHDWTNGATFNYVIKTADGTLIYKQTGTFNCGKATAGTSYQFARTPNGPDAPSMEELSGTELTIEFTVTDGGICYYACATDMLVGGLR